MKVSVQSSGGVASHARIGDHELVFDQGSNVPGGEDRGPSPLDAMLASVAGCAHYFAAAFFRARGISPDGLRVDVEAVKARDPEPRLARIALEVHLPAGVPERYLAAVERVVRGCPALGTLLRSPELELTVHREPGAEDEPLQPTG